jgi:hypothetical protein
MVPYMALGVDEVRAAGFCLQAGSKATLPECILEQREPSRRCAQIGSDELGVVEHGTCPSLE